MPEEKFIYYCNFCKEEFIRELTTINGIIEEGQQVKCSMGHFIPTLDFVRKLTLADKFKK